MRWSGCRVFIGAALLILGIFGIGSAMPDPVAGSRYGVHGTCRSRCQKHHDHAKKRQAREENRGPGDQVECPDDCGLRSEPIGQKPGRRCQAGSAPRRGDQGRGRRRQQELHRRCSAPAKTLSVNIAAAGKANGKKVNLVAAINPDLEELMYQLKKTSVGGLGIEEDIKDNAKDKPKNPMKPPMAAAVAQRVLIVSDFCETMGPLAASALPNLKPTGSASTKT